MNTKLFWHCQSSDCNSLVVWVLFADLLLGIFHRCRPWEDAGSTCPQSEVSPGPVGWLCTESLLAPAAPPRQEPKWSSSSVKYSAGSQSTPVSRHVMRDMQEKKMHRKPDNIGRKHGEHSPLKLYVQMSVSGCAPVHWSAASLLQHFHHLKGAWNINWYLIPNLKADRLLGKDQR